MKSLTKRSLLLGAIGASAAISAYFTLPVGRVDRQVPEFDLANADTTAVPDMTLGDPSAEFELIEYASFTCPHCAHFAKDVFPQLKADYIDTGKISYTHREVFFDRLALWAAMMARCDAGEQYFPAVKAIYEKQSQWTSGETEEEIKQSLLEIGVSVGMTPSRVTQCLGDVERAKSILANYQKNKEEHGITSTPSFVIGGKTYKNMPYAQLSELIDAELAR